MIKQMIFLFLWTSLALYCFAAATVEIPKECAVGTPDYNETLCSETCTKDIHMNQSYCGNFTKPTGIPNSQPKQPEVLGSTPMPEVTRIQEVSKIDVTTPKSEVGKVQQSSGISHGYSVLLSVSSFLLWYLIN